MSSDESPSPVRFRHHAAVPMAAIAATIATTTIATARWWLLPLLLIPLAVAWWGIRATTRADLDGLAIRRFVGTQRIPWSKVRGISVARRRVYAELTDDTSVALPTVTPDGVVPMLELAAASAHKLKQSIK